MLLQPITKGESSFLTNRCIPREEYFRRKVAVTDIFMLHAEEKTTIMSQADLQSAIAALQEQVKVLQDAQKNETQRQKDGKLPLALSRKVKAVYGTLVENFEFRQPFRAEVNGIVTELIITAVTDETEYEPKLVRRAVQRFYEGRKRLAVTSTHKKEDWNARKKLRSRRERLFTLRRKYARGEEVEILGRLHPDAMSDEESEGEDLVVRSPVWRDSYLSGILHAIDLRIKATRTEQGLSFYCSRKRRRGENSRRIQPSCLSEEFIGVEEDVLREYCDLDRNGIDSSGEGSEDNSNDSGEGHFNLQETETVEMDEVRQGGGRTDCLADRRRHQLAKLKELRLKRLHKLRR